MEVVARALVLNELVKLVSGTLAGRQRNVVITALSAARFRL